MTPCPWLYVTREELLSPQLALSADTYFDLIRSRIHIATDSATYVGEFMSRLEQGVSEPLNLDPYTTVDVSLGYAWDQLKLTGYDANLFDTAYHTYEYGPDAYATLGDRLNYTF